MQRSGRAHERFKVRLEVRFARAVDFVTQYAENLSAGGLFVAGGEALEPLTSVSVAVELPGHGTFEVVAKVAHILDAETAARFGVPPGAGLEIVERPPGFEMALASYLTLLGRRRDARVFVCEEAACAELGDAGFDTEAVAVADLAGALAAARGPVLGIVAPAAEIPRCRQLLGAAAGDLLVDLPEGESVRDLFAALDERLRTLAKRG